MLLLYDDAMLAHDAGRAHPERPERLAAVRAALAETTLEHARWAAPAPATDEQILRVHEEPYLALLRSLRGRSRRLDPDTAVCPDSFEAALLAAGGAVGAAEAVLGHDASSAFALVRPPGHHAEPGRAMGFCLLNNIAIAAAHALAQPACRRVLIVDWDVHHGNGTQAAFYERDDVLLFSIHQDRLFPDGGGTDEAGRGPGAGYTVNAPMPAGAGDAEYAAVFRRLLVPVADGYAPDLVLVSAGFDAHARDPLGDMRLSTGGFVHLLQVVRRIADRHAGGRLALVLEGGYDLDALGRCVRACVLALADPPPPETDDPPADTRLDLTDLLRAHRRHWPALGIA